MVGKCLHFLRTELLNMKKISLHLSSLFIMISVCCIASSHFHVVEISVSETVLDTNLRLGGTPEHRRTQIAVCPKTRGHERLVGHQALCLRLYLALPQ